jgi:hypothetical protein
MASHRLPHQAQIAILARHYARNEVKARLKEQLGIQARYVEAKEITIAAELLLKQRWERFAEQAQFVLTKIESDAQKRKASSYSLGHWLAAPETF